MRDSQNEHPDDLLHRATEALRRATIPPGPPVERVAAILEAAERHDSVPLTIAERVRTMARRLPAKLTVAAAILVVVGLTAFWAVIGGSSPRLAFAAVADALDSLRSATYDITMDVEEQPPVTGTGKGFFLAPSRQRTEISTGLDKKMAQMITIVDNSAGKGLMLMPKQKLALVMDTDKMRQKTEGVPPDLFETVRRLVRQGVGPLGDKPEMLGKKQIDGREAIGFRTHSHMGDLTLWADPETARPIRIEVAGEMWDNVHMVMDHFRYDVALDPSLFSLEPPTGYSTQTLDYATPAEQDLLTTLRTVAEKSDGVFPEKLGMNKEVMKSLMEVIKPGMEKLEAKYGIKPKPGEQPPAAMMAEAMKTLMPLFQEQMQGIMFYMMLKPENDPHYVGGGVKLGTPDHAILWYKPTGAQDYRVLYADLSVKEMTPEEVKNLPEAQREHQ